MTDYNISEEDLMLLIDSHAGKGSDDQLRIAKEVIAFGAQMLRKNKDYGSSIWTVPVLAPECNPGLAIRVRMSDKISRLASLLKSKQVEVQDESIDDTLRDLAAYCILELARPGRES